VSHTYNNAYISPALALSSLICCRSTPLNLSTAAAAPLAAAAATTAAAAGGLLPLPILVSSFSSVFLHLEKCSVHSDPLVTFLICKYLKFHLKLTFILK